MNSNNKINSDSEKTASYKLAHRVALIAGNGQFPLDFAKKAKQQGAELTVIAFEGETSPELLSYACAGFHTIKVGQLGKLLKILKKSKVSQAAFAGGISRVRLFKNCLPDLAGLRLAAKVGSIKDDVLLRAIAAEISSLGIEVINAAYFLDQAVPQAGVLTKRSLTEAEKQDALLGWEAAKLIGSIDIGQAVVVHKTMIIAVEAIEGTDEMIKRAGGLTGFNMEGSHIGTANGAAHQQPDVKLYKDLSVLVKVCKPQQDRRLDLPTFGPKTIEIMCSNGISALVIEANASLLIDPINTVQLANKYGMAIFAAKQQSDLLTTNNVDRDFSFRNT